MNKLGRRSVLTLLAVATILLILVACGGGEEAPSDTSTSDTPTATVAGDTPVDISPTATSVAESQDASRMSLDEYMAAAFCGSTEEGGDWEEGVSVKEISSGLAQVIEQGEALEPPAEVSDWHDASLAFGRAFKKTIDDYLEDPKGRTEDEFLLSNFVTLAPHFQPVEEAIADMDPDVRARMIEAGCIEEETTTATSIEAEEISVGGSVEGAFEEPNEIDYFLFQAEMGQDYLIKVTWDELEVVQLRVLDLLNPVDLPEISDRSLLVRRWTAPKSGTFHIEMHAGVSTATGSYTVSVSIDDCPDCPAYPPPPPPTNQRYAILGAGYQISVTWDAVDGAGFYKVYHNNHRSCSVDRSGSPSSCELVEQVSQFRVSTGTYYTHTNLDPVEKNYYWVVACSKDGCSEVDSENPATPAEN